MPRPPACKTQAGQAEHALEQPCTSKPLHRGWHTHCCRVACRQQVDNPDRRPSSRVAQGEAAQALPRLHILHIQHHLLPSDGQVARVVAEAAGMDRRGPEGRTSGVRWKAAHRPRVLQQARGRKQEGMGAAYEPCTAATAGQAEAARLSLFSGPPAPEGAHRVVHAYVCPLADEVLPGGWEEEQLGPAACTGRQCWCVPCRPLPPLNPESWDRRQLLHCLFRCSTKKAPTHSNHTHLCVPQTRHRVRAAGGQPALLAVRGEREHGGGVPHERVHSPHVWEAVHLHLATRCGSGRGCQESRREGVLPAAHARSVPTLALHQTQRVTAVHPLPLPFMSFDLFLSPMKIGPLVGWR